MEGKEGLTRLLLAATILLVQAAFLSEAAASSANQSRPSPNTFLVATAASLNGELQDTGIDSYRGTRAEEPAVWEGLQSLVYCTSLNESPQI